jgi:starvation-inducible DNA-binding protein
MTPNTGLDENKRTRLEDILNQLVADQALLYTKTRNYHWNVVGASFYEIHIFLEKQYTELAVMVDETAERVTSLGGRAIGSLAEFLRHTRLSENPGELPNSHTMIAHLLTDHETIIRNLREDVKKCEELEDSATEDFLISNIEQHEKMAWMLRSFLQER